MTHDVCLVLEGTYPYLPGGVSTWVDGLVRGLPDLRFAVVHLRDAEAPRRPARSMPGNVRTLVDVQVDPERPPAGEALDDLPDARLIHSLSSGLSGLTGATLSRRRDRPLLVTEHGLAWREALMGTGELESGRPLAAPARRRADRALQRAQWSRSLQAMARAGYDQAAAITTVCAANARWQRRLGAPAERSSVVANSVGAGWRPGDQRPDPDRPLFVLVGRVVPIKDVLGFLLAARLVLDARPAARFAVVGPLDQDHEYAATCLERSQELGLGEAVRFCGETDPRPWVRAASAVVLTSVSEAQPLALIEAMASGVAVVAPRIGGCEELVAGVGGHAGLLTCPGDAVSTARAMLRLAADAGLRARLARGGLARVLRRHRPGGVPRAYGRIYDRLVHGGAVA
jgi:glycosyltransferase involved in cell wall biosynthesis